MRSQKLFGRVWRPTEGHHGHAMVRTATGNQSVVPEEPYYSAAQHGRMGYRLSPRGHLQ